MTKAILTGLLFFTFFIFNGCKVDDNPSNNSTNQRPIISALIATPLTVMPDDTSIVTLFVSDPDLDVVTVSYEATGGTVTGAGAVVNFIADTSEGTGWVTVTVDDHHGGITTGSASINVIKIQPIISIGVQILDTGSGDNQCLVFTALAGEDLIIVRIQVESPDGTETEVFGSGYLDQNSTISLQSSGQCYTKMSGAYKFKFALQRTEGDPFDFETTYIQP